MNIVVRRLKRGGYSSYSFTYLPSQRNGNDNHMPTRRMRILNWRAV